MARYELRFSRAFIRELRRLRRSGQSGLEERISRSVRALAEDPFTPRPGVDIARLRLPGERLFRLRVGEYRVLYEVELGQRVITVTSVFHRGKGYDLG